MPFLSSFGGGSSRGFFPGKGVSLGLSRNPISFATNTLPSDGFVIGDVITLNTEGIYTLPKTLFEVSYFNSLKCALTGASGGGGRDEYNRGGQSYQGRGGFMQGHISLATAAATGLVVVVGGKGISNSSGGKRISPGGYNGGGDGCTGWSFNFSGGKGDCGGGGGATDVRRIGSLSDWTNNLSDRILVAGGGGGADNYDTGRDGGSGGYPTGTTGNSGVTGTDGGTQTQGGNFGQTGSQTDYGSDSIPRYAGSESIFGTGKAGGFGYGGAGNGGGGHGVGGGGGWYGGAGDGHDNSGGGSSYYNSSYVSSTSHQTGSGSAGVNGLAVITVL